MRYAEIDAAGLCFAVSDLSAPVGDPNLIPIGENENPLGWRWDGTQFVPAPVAPEPVWVSQIEFERLFPGAVRRAIRQARKTDSILDDFWALLEAAGGCYLNDPDMQAGIQYLVTANYLTQAQADKIKAGVGL